jgi:Reverse transcriptase-like
MLYRSKVFCTEGLIESHLYVQYVGPNLRCPHARATWLASPLHLNTPELPLDLLEAIKLVLENHDTEKMRLAAYLQWNIWKAKNKMIFESLPPDPLYTVTASLSMSRVATNPLPHTTPAPAFSALPETTHSMHTLAAGRAFSMTDASLDVGGKAWAAIAFFYDTGDLQFVYYAPVQAESPFHAEAAALAMALREWSSPFVQAPAIIFSDCKQLVEFLRRGNRESLPCLRGARDAFGCLRALRTRTEAQPPVTVEYVGRTQLRLVHELANLARRSGTSYIGSPSMQELHQWGLSSDLLDLAGDYCRGQQRGQKTAVIRLEAANIDPG